LFTKLWFVMSLLGNQTKNSCILLIQPSSKRFWDIVTMRYSKAFWLIAFSMEFDGPIDP